MRRTTNRVRNTGPITSQRRIGRTPGATVMLVALDLLLISVVPDRPKVKEWSRLRREYHLLRGGRPTHSGRNQAVGRAKAGSDIMSFIQDAQRSFTTSYWIVSRAVVREPGVLRGIRRVGPGRSGCHGGQLAGETGAHGDAGFQGHVSRFWKAHASLRSTRTAPVSRVMASSWGKLRRPWCGAGSRPGGEDIVLGFVQDGGERRRLGLSWSATRRSCWLAWTSRLRMQCVGQCCRAAPRTRVAAVCRPLRSSEITNWTPHGPEGLGLRCADRHAEHLAPAWSLLATAMAAATETLRPTSRSLTEELLVFC